jgi:hypothetical protein
MAGLGCIECPGKILVALQAGIANRPLEQPLFIRFVGVVAPGAFTDRCGTMQILPLEGGAIMAAEAEFRLVGADVKQETVGGAMGLVAAEAVPLPVGGMDHLLLPPGAVALAAEQPAPGSEFETLTPPGGMFPRFPLMAGEAVPVLYRLVEVLQAADGLVAKSGDACIGKSRKRGQDREQEQNCIEQQSRH